MSLVRSASCLRVADLPGAVSGFVDRLGFDVRGVWGEPPGFAIVGRDRITVMLKATEPQAVMPARDPTGGVFDVYIYCEDADALHGELAGRGAELMGEPEDQPHGCREFFVRAPEGYVLLFGQDLN